jgi:hypothetical protein
MKVVVKDYIGDGVYAECDGDYIILTTENGVGENNIIYIDKYVLEALKRFIARTED